MTVSISALANSLTGATLASDDLFVTVDTSANETKKLTAQALLDGAVSQAFYDYADLATASSALSITASTWTELPNDGAGSATLLTYALPGVANVWDTTNDEFDFAGLSLGDTVDIRFDIAVTTTAANQVVRLRLNFNNGGTPFQLTVYDNQYKTAAAHSIATTAMIYLGTAAVKNNPITVEVWSDDTATAVITGWIIRVVPRHAKVGV